MATKTANVMARVEPDIKMEAEAILSELGIPVSVLINSLYRQIIMTNGIPFSLSVSRPKARDEMSDEEFEKLMEERIASAKSGNRSDADEFFSRLEKEIKDARQISGHSDR